MTAVEKLAAMTQNADSEALEACLELARDMFMDHCRRDDVPEELRDAQVHIAAVLYNRMGMEGEKSHNEGGVNRTVQALPDDIAARLKPWRLARTVHGMEGDGQ